MRHVLVVLVAALLLAACQTGSVRQVDSLTRRPAGTRVVLMPVNVQLYELSAAGLEEPKSDWTAQGRHLLTEAFAQEAARRGLSFLDYRVTRVSERQDERLIQIQRLHAAVGSAILRHRYSAGQDLPAKRGAFDWSLGPSVAALREASGADYALFVHVRDSYAGAGRVAVMVVGAVVGVVPRGGYQSGFASLVDLTSGDVVWFNHLGRGSGDLRDPRGASETAQALLDGFPS